MTSKQIYAGFGAFAAIVAVVGLAIQAGIRDASAQQAQQPAATQTQQPETQQQQELQTPQTQQERQRVGELERRPATERDERDATRAKQALRASDLIGMNVRGRDDDEENIGSIDDPMISRDGEVIYVAVSYGGFLGIGDRLVAVPMDSLEIVQREEGIFTDQSFARLDITEEQLRQTEGFDRNDWPQQADTQFQRDQQRRVERPGAETDVTR